MPCSFAQERMWLLQRMEPETTAYNVMVPLRVDGRLDARAMRNALVALVERHEILRTGYVETSDGVLQVVKDTNVATVSCETDEVLSEEALEQCIAAERAHVFDLESGAVFRARLLRTEGGHVLVLNVHHIAYDGWSGGILQQDLDRLYRAQTAGIDADMPPLVIQYGDFSIWQRQHVSADRRARQLAFWNDRLADAEPLQLPTDLARPPVRTGAGGYQRFHVPAGEATGLQAVCEAKGASLFMGVLTAFKVLLARYSGTRDIVVGTPTSGRRHSAVERNVGLFVNTVVVRSSIDVEGDFMTALEGTRAAVLDALAHEDLPFEQVVDAIVTQRDTSRTPLFQVLFAHNQAARRDGRIGDLRVRLLDAQTDSSKFDLSLHSTETAEGLDLGIEYSTDLFLPETITRMGEHLCRLVQALGTHGNAPLSAVSLMGPEELDLVTRRWASNAAPYPRDQDVPSIFAEVVRRDPAASAVTEAGSSFSYEDLDRRSSRVGVGLQRLGVRAGDRVAVAMNRSYDTLAAMLGVLKCGAAFVPLDPTYPETRLRHVFEDAAVSAVVARERSALPNVVRTSIVLVLDDAFWASDVDASALVPVRVGPRAPAYIMYTSGSTGEPKGVVVPHRAILRLVRGTDFCRWGPDQVVLQHSALGFDASTFEIWGPLLNGGTVALARPGAMGVAQLGQEIRSAHVTTLWLTAPLFHLVIDEDPALLTGVEELLTGGDIVSPAHVAAALDALPRLRIINGYGPTESTTFATCNPIVRDDLTGRIPIGAPIANTTVYVLDPGMQPTPVGVPGELYIGGDGLALGYHGRGELSAERFVTNPLDAWPNERLYRTGDRVRWRDDGRLDFLGRFDDQVKIRGFRVEPGEIEHHLRAHPALKDCFVFVRGAGDQKRLVAYVVPATNARDLQDSIREHLAARLPSHLIPTGFVELDALPLTANGKVDRSALPKDEAIGPRSSDRDAAPCDAIEAAIADIWTDVLAIPYVGRDDDFFAVGGHSLLATRLAARLGKALSIDVALRDVFECPTVSSLADRVRSHLDGDTAEVRLPLVRVPRGGELRLSFEQERMWFLNRLEPDNAAYNVPLALRLDGPLDGGRMLGALRDIVHRHEVLRSVYAEGTDGPFQVPLEAETVPLELVDLQGEADVEDALQQRLSAESCRPFKLEEEPPMRGSLYVLGSRLFVLSLVFHHVAIDGWSVSTLLQDLARRYEQSDTAMRSTDPDTMVQYADFAHWQRSIAKGSGGAALARWVDRLRSVTPLDLGYGTALTGMASGEAGEIGFRWPAELHEGLRDLCAQEGTTLFMGLLSCFQSLLGRYACQEDLTVGTPIAGRMHPDTHSMVGFFANTLVLRADLSGHPSFREVLRRTRTTCVDAYGDQGVPFEQIVDALHVPRNLARTPLFQAMFVLNQERGATRLMRDVDVRPLSVSSGMTKFDLTLTMAAGPDGVRGVVEYRRQRLERAFMEMFVRHLGVFAEQVIADPDAPIDRVSLLSAADRDAFLHAQPTVEGEPSLVPLPESLRTQAMATPGALAVTCGLARFTYAELDLAVDRVAVALARAGVGTCDLVAVAATRAPETLPVLLGVLRAGAAYVPIDPDVPSERWAFILEDTRARLLVVDDTLAGSVPSVCPVASPQSLVAGSVEPHEVAALPVVASTDLAYVVYTSGSSGTPKGTLVEHGGLSNYLTWAASEYLGVGGTGSLVHSSLAYDLQVTALFAPLLRGQCVRIIPQGAGPDGLAIALQESDQVGFVKLTPSHLALLREQLHLPSLKGAVHVFVVGGEALSMADLDPWFAQVEGVRFVNEYGPTETVVGSCAQWVDSAAEGVGPVPIGRAIRNTRLYVLDNAGDPVPRGVAGELYIGGAGVARGYLNRPDVEARQFLPDPFVSGARMYRTGDRVRALGDGRLVYLGRVDDQIKLRGHRIEPGEIVAAIRAVAGEADVRDATVTVRTAPSGDDCLVAYVVLGSDVVRPMDWRRMLADRLPAHMVPLAVKAIPSMPLTRNGKLDIDRLPPVTLTPAVSDEAYVAPLTEAERGLAEIWQSLLGLTNVSAKEDFFGAGGHSLLAVRLLRRIHEQWAVELPVRVVFERPVLADLAAFLEEALSNSGERR